MSEHSRAMTIAALGAVGGAVVGYLLFTDKGRTLRRELEQTVEDTRAELDGFRTAVRKAGDFASESWRMLNEAIGKGDRGVAVRALRYRDR